MPEIVGTPINQFLDGKAGANYLVPIPRPGLDQRGPSCGFYALGVVLEYWCMRQKTQSLALGLTGKALPARTNMGAPKPAPRDTKEKSLRKQKAIEEGEYTSLRQFAKVNNLTQYGPVFNAENLVKVARGQSVQGKDASYQGQFDGKVVTVPNATEFATKIVTAIRLSCPVLVPYDAQDNGDPCTNTGRKAHWATVIGTYEENDGTHLVFVTWGGYFHCAARDMGISCTQLASNRVVEVEKFQALEEKDDTASYRDYDDPHNSYLTRLKTNRKLRDEKKYEKLGLGQSVEFCDPVGLWKQRELRNKDSAPEELTGLRKRQWCQLTDPMLQQAGFDSLTDATLRQAGFDPANLANVGLKSKLVLIYPKQIEAEFATL